VDGKGTTCSGILSNTEGKGDWRFDKKDRLGHRGEGSAFDNTVAKEYRLSRKSHKKREAARKSRRSGLTLKKNELPDRGHVFEKQPEARQKK